jgi:hypothetical protein
MIRQTNLIKTVTAKFKQRHTTTIATILFNSIKLLLQRTSVNNFMKIIMIICISFFLLSGTSIAQESSINKYETSKISIVKLTVFKNSKEGQTFETYYFNKKKIHVYGKPFPKQNYKEHLHTIHKYNSKEFFLDISKLNLTLLKETYLNNCIDTTNGQDFSIIIGAKTKSTSINLHHYYLKGIEDLITLINKYLPQSLRIKYLDKETKQDCIR